jgi:hypothetical protein
VLGWDGASWAPTTPAAGGALALPYAAAATSAANTSLFKVTQQGAGIGGEFLATGGGTAVRGASLGGAGVSGTASLAGSAAVGVRAEHTSETGTALEIAKGAFRVAGAGLNTNTAVFWTRMSDLQRNCFQAVGGSFVCNAILDHPLTNGAPGAILTVTSRVLIPGIQVPTSMAVYYDSALARWRLHAVYSSSFSDLDGSRFNIMIVKP